MRRRDFIILLGGTAVAWPVPARAQAATPVLGFLSSLSRAESVHFEDAFRRGLDELGYVAGRNLSIEFRFADGRYDKLPRMAADLVQLPVAVIVAASPPAALAAKAATSVTPIVFLVAYDPVAAGLVSSLNRPGGNVTGVTFLGSPLAAKRLELLRELAPNGMIAVLTNPISPDSGPDTAEIRSAAPEIGQRLRFFGASTEQGISTAFAELAQAQAGGLLVLSDPFFTNRRVQIVGLAERLAIPTVYPFREFVAFGGLMSYGVSLTDSYRQAGVYAARILKGAKPADLPVTQPTKFELVINLKTAKALGITVPVPLLARADEVIE